tara:strand:- start:4165 stop:4590 length:426 start_codon:yes stop_codon:yes gene_type:complete
MTRISSTVRPIELCDKMLIAEHREIIRIPNCINSGKAKVIIKDIPAQYKLGSGHVKFFYDKLYYLYKRYCDLYDECIKRGFNVQDYSLVFENVPDNLFNDWQPDHNLVRPIIVQRINERLGTMKNIKYYGKDFELEKIKLC